MRRLVRSGLWAQLTETEKAVLNVLLETINGDELRQHGELVMWPTRHRILSKMLDLQRGDAILVPRMPSQQEMTVALVSGPYTFDDRHCATVHHDFGHVIPIDAANMTTYGYGYSDATQRISGMFQHFRSAVTPVRNANIRGLILKLAP